VTLEKVKSTFVATELRDEKKTSKSKENLDQEGLLEDRESDSEFDIHAE
jgi:hypothetical protein